MAQCDHVAFLGTSWTGGALADGLNLHAYQCYHLSGRTLRRDRRSGRAVFGHRAGRAQGPPGPEDNVAVVGAGPIGLMALMAAGFVASKQVVAFEVAERRIEAARLCGADAVIDPSREDAEKRGRELTNGRASTS